MNAIQTLWNTNKKLVVCSLVICLVCSGLSALASFVATTRYYSAPTPTTQVQKPTQQLSAPTEFQPVVISSTPTNTPRPTKTPKIIESSTPRPCMNHKTVSIKISYEETLNGNFFHLKSTADCLMLTENGIGQPVIGKLVQENITIRGIKYHQYWEFIIKVKPDRQAEKGLYVEDLFFFEFEANGYGWTDENPKPGQYWYLMKYKIQPTHTPKP